MRRWNTPDQKRELRRRSTVAAVAGVLLIAVAVLATVFRLLPDLASTVLGILGVAGLVYGVAIGIQVLLDSEPDENEPGPWVRWGRRDDD